MASSPRWGSGTRGGQSVPQTPDHCQPPGSLQGRGLQWLARQGGCWWMVGHEGRGLCCFPALELPFWRAILSKTLPLPSVCPGPPGVKVRGCPQRYIHCRTCWVRHRKGQTLLGPLLTWHLCLGTLTAGCRTSPSCWTSPSPRESGSIFMGPQGAEISPPPAASPVSRAAFRQEQTPGLPRSPGREPCSAGLPLEGERTHRVTSLQGIIYPIDVSGRTASASLHRSSLQETSCAALSRSPNATNLFRAQRAIPS